MINKYANLGEPREDNHWNFANRNILYSYCVVSDCSYYYSVLAAHYQKSKDAENRFLDLVFCKFIGEKQKFLCYIKMIDDALVSQTRFHKIIPGMWRKWLGSLEDQCPTVLKVSSTLRSSYPGKRGVMKTCHDSLGQKCQSSWQKQGLQRNVCLLEASWVAQIPFGPIHALQVVKSGGKNMKNT